MKATVRKACYAEILDNYNLDPNIDKIARMIAKLEHANKTYVLRELGNSNHPLISEENLSDFEAALALCSPHHSYIHAPSIGWNCLTEKTPQHLVKFVVDQHQLYDDEKASMFFDRPTELFDTDVQNHIIKHYVAPDFSSLDDHSWDFMLEQAKKQSAILSWLIASPHLPDRIAQRIVQDANVKDFHAVIRNMAFSRITRTSLNPIIRTYNLTGLVNSMKLQKIKMDASEVDILNLQLYEEDVVMFDKDIEEMLNVFYKELLIEEETYAEGIATNLLNAMGREVFLSLPKMF